jgi:hypothetical protein
MSSAQKNFTAEEVKKIYDSVLSDPKLLDSINANDYLDAVENKNNTYLENKTSNIIVDEIVKSFNDLGDDEPEFRISNNDQIKYIKALSGYRYVDELDVLHLGKYTRWIQKYADTAPYYKMASGGFLVAIDFIETGIILTVKIWRAPWVIRISFDDCLIYQKLSYGEYLVLMANDYLLSRNN